MNKEFKKILLNLANLGRADQQWVLKQLTQKQREQFKKLQGDVLLKEARKFRKLPCPQLPQIQQTIQLPEACAALRQEVPLYIAIILEQGQFNWEQTFINTCDQRDEIAEQLGTRVKDLKPATKSLVFQQWQTELSFEDQLRTTHG